MGDLAIWRTDFTSTNVYAYRALPDGTGIEVVFLAPGKPRSGPGARYVAHVPEDEASGVMAAFDAASSKGSFWARRIKPFYAVSGPH